MITTLPVVIALCWVPVNTTAVAQPASCCTPAKAEQQAPKADAETITCPITGGQILACCCPVKQ